MVPLLSLAAIQGRRALAGGELTCGGLARRMAWSARVPGFFSILIYGRYFVWLFSTSSHIITVSLKLAEMKVLYSGVCVTIRLEIGSGNMKHTGNSCR